MSNNTAGTAWNSTARGSMFLPVCPAVACVSVWQLQLRLPCHSRPAADDVQWVQPAVPWHRACMQALKHGVVGITHCVQHNSIACSCCCCSSRQASKACRKARQHAAGAHCCCSSFELLNFLMLAALVAAFVLLVVLLLAAVFGFLLLLVAFG